MQLLKKHKARWLLFYLLPIILFTPAYYFNSIDLSGKDFWIPFLWGLWMPWFNGQNPLFKNNTKFIFRSFNEKPYVPFGICILHGTVWSIATHIFDFSILRVLFFFCFFLTYDYFLLKNNLLQVFSLPIKFLHNSVITKLLAFGIVWWGYLAIALAVIQNYVADTPINILLYTLFIIIPAQLYLLFFTYRKPISLNLKKVAVIGAGWNGIYAGKWLKEFGIEVKVLEKTDTAGGIWKFETNRSVGVSEQTYASSSKNYLHASDLSMPKEFVYFPHRQDVLNFINRYIDLNDLNENIHYSTDIEKATKRGDKWVITGHKGGLPFTEEFDAIVVAAGANQQSKPIGFDDKYKHFTGKVIHSSEYKNTDNLGKYQSIAIIGLGESGTDIAHECANTKGKKVYWGGSDSQWFAGKLIGGNSAADEFMAPGIRAILSNFLMFEDLGRAYVSKVIGIVWGTGGSGIKEFKPKYSWMTDFVTKSMHAIFDVHDGKITPFGKIKKIESDCIYSEEGKKIAVDLIIDCTGYLPNYPFLEQQFDIWKTYDMVFAHNDSTLSFVGTARPILGSIPALGELQARWVASVYSGQSMLPNKEQQLIETVYNKEIHKQRFPNSLKRPNLVDHEFYANKIAEKMRISVPWLYLFIFKNRLFRLLLNAPWMPFKYNIREDFSREKAIEHIQLNMPSKTVPFYGFISTFKLHAIYLLMIAAPLALAIVLYVPTYISVVVFTVWLLRNIIDFFIGKYLFVPPNGVLPKAKLDWIEKSFTFKRKSLIAFTLLFPIGFVATLYLLYLGYGGYREFIIFLIGYFISVIGLEIGYHRYYSHRSFKANNILQFILSLFGIISGSGPSLYWVAMHKIHHKHADHEQDPHSPIFDKTKSKSWIKKFLHAHFLWVYESEQTNKNSKWISEVKDLVRNPIAVFFCSTNLIWFVGVGFILPAVVNGMITHSWMGALLGLLWGGFFRVFVVINFSWAINSICHLFGSRPFNNLKDNSRNLGFIAIPTLGESYHNNHHAFPNSANLRFKWWQFDLGYWVIRFFNLLGWAWDINSVTKENIRMKMK